MGAVGYRLAARRQHLAHVVTGAKGRARAGQHHAADAFVASGLLEGRLQFGDRLQVEGVDRRPVEGQGQDTIL